MSLILVLARLLIAISAFIVTATWATGVTSHKRTPVEFWHVGDDALSERLAKQTEGLFKRSPDFTLSSGRKPGTLIVTIPTNVEWQRVGKRDRVHYSVEFSSIDGQKLGVRAGSAGVIIFRHVQLKSSEMRRLPHTKSLMEANSIRAQIDKCRPTLRYQDPIAMSEIEKWIEDAAQDLNIGLRKLSSNEAESVQNQAKSRYVKISDPRVWWVNLARPIDEYYDRTKVKLSQILPDNPGACWLIPETGAKLLPVYEIDANGIERLIENCPGFEYNIVALDFSWLVIETDHDQYYVCRSSGILPELMAGSN